MTASVNQDKNGNYFLGVASSTHALSLASLFLSGVALLAGCDSLKLGPDTAVVEPESATGLVAQEWFSGSILRHKNRIVIDNVERVFMHQPGVYSVLVREGEGLKQYLLSNNDQRYRVADFKEVFGTDSYIKIIKPTELVVDVKPDRSNWVEVSITTDENKSFFIEAEIKIHLSHSHDIVGGGYSNQVGKIILEEDTTSLK